MPQPPVIKSKRPPAQSPKAARQVTQTSPGGLSYIIQPLRHLAVAISSVHQDPANLRVHSGRNLAAIESSLVRFGQYEPIIVRDSTGIILAGNARHVVATRLGWTHIAAVFVNETQARALDLAITDNRSGDLSFFDPVILRTQALTAQAAGIDLAFFGFAPKDLSASWAASTVDPAAIAKYDAADERAILKIEHVPTAIASTLVADINRELSKANFDLRAVVP